MASDQQSHHGGGQQQQYERRSIQTTTDPSGMVSHRLPDMEVEKFQILEVIRSLLHTILFHRALGPVQPELITSDLFNVVYCRCDSSSAVEAVESAVNRFEAATHLKVSPSAFRSEFTLKLLERKVTKVFGFTSSVEHHPWEEWKIPFIVDVTPRDPSNDSAAVLERARQQQALELELRSRIFDIAQVAVANTSHVKGANVAATDPMMYPVEIDVAGQNQKAEIVGGETDSSSKSGWNMTARLSDFSTSKLGYAPRSRSGSGGSSQPASRARSQTDNPTSKVSHQIFRQSVDENEGRDKQTQKGDGYFRFKLFAGPPKIT